MRTIIRIVGVEKHKGYSLTHVVTDDGTEATGYGTDFKVGDKVELFFHAKWNRIKIRLAKEKSNGSQSKSD